MHYHRMAFTKNGKPTILAIDNENMEFGTPEGRFSARDVVKINALYDCKSEQYFLFFCIWSRSVTINIKYKQCLFTSCLEVVYISLRLY